MPGSRWTLGPSVALAIALCSRPAAAEPAAITATITAGLASGSIHADGILDEPAWADAAVIEDLTQQDPHPGEPTPFRTQVRILVDAENLYFGFRCSDPEPSRIAVHTLGRDGVFEGDDHLAIALDTFQDGRTGYVFRINAAGARQDGLIAGPESESADWDGIWQAGTATTPDGWSAEIVLPARTLHFPPGAASWGLNIQRVVSRSRLTLRWAALSLDAGFIDLRRSGRLAGVEALRQGLGLTVSPYGLSRYDWQRDRNRGVTKPDEGLDVTYNLTPSVTGALTINTDFAETDADVQQINLTRFPLFYPEKRAFFLEGANMFEFGSGLGESFLPFFSRRVGLFENRPVPIRGGAKVLGRAGRWGLALVDAYTDALGPEGDLPGAPRGNLAAGRVTYDASSNLRVGTIVTNGDPAGAVRNTLLGADVLWQTSTFLGTRNFAIGGWYARSFGSEGGGDADGYGFKIDYPNDLWNAGAIFNKFGRSLEPKLGFLPRPGRRLYEPFVSYQPRPQGGLFGWVRQFYFEFEPSLVTTVDGRVESWQVFTAPFNAQTQSGEHLEANWAPQFERVFEPFEISEGVVIPPADYHFTRYRIEAQSSEYRPWTIGSTVWFGDFYGGRLAQTLVYATYTTPSGRQHFEFTTENDFGPLPQGDFVERLHQVRWTWAFNPDLGLSFFAQQEVGSGNLGWNARLKWTVTPGDDVFLVWNRNWIQTPGDDGARWARVGDQVVAKVRLAFRR